MLFEGGFTFATFVADAFAIFMFILGSGCSLPRRATCSAAMTYPASARCSG